MSLHIENISFSYNTTPVLTDISALIEPGKFYAIVGPNGSGKTTLMDLVSGYYTPSSGKVTINGTPVFRMTRNQMARTLSLVSQENRIRFSFKVRDIILMGRHPYIQRFSQPSKEDLSMVDDVMQLCRIDHLADRRIDSLSGGEKQRCLFARALCQDTPILLLDEAFSNMDISHTLHLLKLLKDLTCTRNRTVLCVLHDLNIAAGWSDEIMMLKQGRLVVSGSTNQIMTEKNIQEVFSVPAVIGDHPETGKRQVYYPTA